LILADVPLNEALIQFNRYHTQRFVIADSSLDGVKISGTFASSSPEHTLAALRAPFHIVALPPDPAHADPEVIRLVRETR
jgi:ferric-dicitrate binding protein FerR (iron transport regulator)